MNNNRININIPLAAELGYFLFFLIFAAIYHIEVFTEGALLVPPLDGVYTYPMFELVDKVMASGEMPYWNPYLFSGSPLMANPQYAVLYPPDVLIRLLSGPAAGYNASFILHFALVGYFTFLFIRQVTGSLPASLITGCAAVSFGFLNQNPDHIMIIKAGAWLPLMLYFLGRLVHVERGEMPLRVSLLSFSVAFCLLAGNAQISIYCFVVLGLYALLLASGMVSWRARRKFFGGFALAFIAGAILALPQLIASSEAIFMSTRDKIDYKFFSSFAMTPDRLSAILFPELNEKPWLAHMGALVPVVALATFVRLFRKELHVRFWGIVAIIAFIFSLGDLTPYYWILYQTPVLNMFRAPERLWVVVYFACLVLAALGLRDMLSGGKTARYYALWFAGAVALMTVLPLLAPQYLLSAFMSGEEVRIGDPRVYVPLVFMAMFALPPLLRSLGVKRSHVALVLALTLIVEAGYYRHDIRSWQADLARDTYAPSPIYQYLDEHKPDRVGFLGMTGYEEKLPINRAVLHEISMTDGYGPIVLRQYFDLTEIWLAGPSTKAGLLVQEVSVLSMLNVRHLVTGNSGLIDIIESFPQYYDKVLQDGKIKVYHNKMSLPRAYPVRQLMPADDSAEVWDIFMQRRANPRLHALLSPDDIAGIGRKEFSAGSVEMLDYGYNDVSLRTTFEGGEGFVVLADQYYPGWRAFVDGEETKVYRVNGTVRGIVVPPGIHNVVFSYSPRNVILASWVSGACLMLIIALCAPAVIGGLRRRFAG